MAKLPMNVVNFAAQTADSALVYELFQDYFCHYMDETQREILVHTMLLALLPRRKLRCTSNFFLKCRSLPT